MKSFAEIDLENNGNYLKLLKAVSKLSGLFSESSIPFINYRVAENIFCKTFNAQNLSRSDIAYDAKINNTGIGLKTFSCTSNHSLEKIAEFNSLSKEFININDEDLAYKLAKFRNDRIELANRLYNIDNSIYHIVARQNQKLILFETDYSLIDVNKIKKITPTKAGIKFTDGINEYSFNRSKSTLYRQFYIPSKHTSLPIEILSDPFDILLKLFEEKEDFITQEKLVPGFDFIILPLYGYDKTSKEKFVFEGSGLNQWNANGRKRNPNEVYIPVPAKIHHKFPNFFPAIESENKKHFKLHLPNNEVYDASMCQTSKINLEGEKVNKGKGLMTYSNKGLGEWILRKALQLKENEIVTYEMLGRIGYDSVIVYKINDNEYKIDIMKINSFEEFKENYLE
ncbi:MAG: restriction endonuclease [Empedobacter falsenii]